MKIRDIVKLTNKYLAGEQLTYAKLLPFLDEVIDDINNTLSSTYPSFTSLGIEDAPTVDDVYDYFPDSYIRSVVAIGAASKFYIMDEEGVDPATDYSLTYRTNLFYMERDFLDHVPELYQSDSTGSTRINEDRLNAIYRTHFDYRIWF